MNSHNGAKVDYQDFDERTVDFVKKLKRVFADINIRIAAVEAIKTMADDFERRYGQVALDRIDAGIAPVLAAATEALDQARADLAAIDAAYRENGIERVDAIINPLVAAAQAALIAADQKVAELEAFLAAKQSVAEKGQANGYAGLDAAGKVPAAQLPALTTTATVGAALAGASQEATPADGDRLAGIKAGGSTPFWITFGNLKARLKSYFDGLYPLASSLGNAATLDVGTTAGTVAAGNDPRLSDAREWTATTVSQAEAEAGTATGRRAWTPQRVKQAILALAPAAPVGLYTGSTRDETVFPVGHIIAASGGADRNQTATVRLHTSSTSLYLAGMGSGAILGGTWRQRGYSGDSNYHLWQRVA